MNARSTAAQALANNCAMKATGGSEGAVSCSSASAPKFGKSRRTDVTRLARNRCNALSSASRVNHVLGSEQVSSQAESKVVLPYPVGAMTSVKGASWSSRLNKRGRTMASSVTGGRRNLVRANGCNTMLSGTPTPSGQGRAAHLRASPLKIVPYCYFSGGSFYATG